MQINVIQKWLALCTTELSQELVTRVCLLFPSKVTGMIDEIEISPNRGEYMGQVWKKKNKT